MGAPPVPTPPPRPVERSAAPRLPQAPAPDASLPSYTETVVGPAPVAPPGHPAARAAAPTPIPRSIPASESADDLLFEAGGLFDDLDEELTRDTAIPISAPATSAPPRDTLPLAPQGATDPGRRGRLGDADTQPNLMGAADVTGRRDTAPRAPNRESRAGTQMQGTEGLQAPAADAPKIRLVPGKVIPGTRYEIRRWLGEGGMGVVYEVAHVDIERRSALKILRFDLSQQPQMAQVFRDEARAASRLGSPYIVEVYDFGELPDGRLYFAMELLEGTDLVPPDEQTGMAPGRLVGILRQVCKGLAKAHEAGVVHRDVKPENILITDTEGRADAVKIVDFGISAMLAAGEQRAGIAGTPHYMAPEQILGDHFDGRLDIYALGCTAYELLVGQPPFDAEEVEHLLKMQVNQAPVPPSQRRPDLEIPPALEAVVMRCLAKDPQQRYADMADLEAALCEAQIAAGLVTGWDDLPVPALPDEERRQRIVARMPSAARPEAKRSLLWPIVAGASTLAAAGLAAFLMFGRQPTEQDKDLVEQLTIDARAAAAKASWVIPPPHLEATETALQKVHELEEVEGSAASMADERGEELREEFATTLIGHGDQLWDGAREFSRQYYVWALMFDEDNAHAMDRANLDVLTLDTYRQRALEGEFNGFERLLAAGAAMDVVEDPEQKAALAVAMNETLQEADDMSPQARETLERQFRKSGVDLPRPKRGSGADAVPPREPTPVEAAARPDPAVDPATADDGEVVEAADDSSLEAVADDEGTVEEDDPQAEAGRRKRRQKVSAGLGEPKTKSDPGRSNELTEQADAKRKQGLRNDAKTLYGQAIAANPANGAAHLGLALVHFDQGSYHQARKSAQQAVRYSPRDGRAHKTLGDAYYKEFRYQDALDAYLEAQKLGMDVKGRIADVKAKLGQ